MCCIVDIYLFTVWTLHLCRVFKVTANFNIQCNITSPHEHLHAIEHRLNQCSLQSLHKKHNFFFKMASFETIMQSLT